MEHPILSTVVLPLASEEDALVTCDAARPFLADHESRVIVVHVIEKAGGYMDTAPLVQRQQQAEEIFAAVDEYVANVPIHVESAVLYGTDIVETILDAADDVSATAIVFTPQSVNRWTKLLAGDTAQRLISYTDRPVLVLFARENTHWPRDTPRCYASGVSN